MVFMVVVVLVVFLIHTAANEVVISPNVNPINSWDYLVFTQQWPETVCSAWKEKGSKNSCNFPRGLDSWTIHGVWPSYDKGMGPQFCNTSWAFNVTKLHDVMANLKQHWPNLYKHTSEDEFWAHEWTKHGTCAASDNLIHNEFGYFESGLTMAAKYNITEALSLAGIIPDSSQTYTVSMIESAIHAHLGVEPVVICYRDKKSKEYLVKEVRLCVNKFLALITCTEQDKTVLLDMNEEGCAKDGTVYYLPVNSTEVTHEEEDDLITSREEL